jgi:hypothetical protein
MHLIAKVMSNTYESEAVDAIELLSVIAKSKLLEHFIENLVQIGC